MVQKVAKGLLSGEGEIMSWATLFSLTNAVAMCGWLALAVLPRKPLTLSAVLYLGVGLLCLAYATLFILSIGQLIDPMRVAGTAEPDLLDYSIAGLRPLFMSDGGIVIGWTHYLAFDLFVGLWIARDADSKGIGRLVQLPFLFFTLMAGPIGLLSWLLFRETRSRRSSPVDG